MQEAPAGFHYFPNIISPDEEQYLLDTLNKMIWEEVKFHGVIAKRRVLHYGLQYDYSSRQAIPGQSIPYFLMPVVIKAAAKMNVTVQEVVEILITEYPPGAGIGWHKDAAVFGEKIFGISLLNSAAFKLRLADNYRQVYKIILAARSGYLISAAARTNWQHNLPPVKEKRYSITFRTLK